MGACWPVSRIRVVRKAVELKHYMPSWELLSAFAPLSVSVGRLLLLLRDRDIVCWLCRLVRQHNAHTHTRYSTEKHMVYKVMAACTTAQQTRRRRRRCYLPHYDKRPGARVYRQTETPRRAARAHTHSSSVSTTANWRRTRVSRLPLLVLLLAGMRA